MIAWILTTSTQTEFNEISIAYSAYLGSPTVHVKPRTNLLKLTVTVEINQEWGKNADFNWAPAITPAKIVQIECTAWLVNWNIILIRWESPALKSARTRMF